MKFVIAGGSGQVGTVLVRALARDGPKLMLEAGALLLRTETELILKSRRVVPGRLLEQGFEFAYPDWNAAARNLCAGRVTPAPARRSRAAAPPQRAADRT